MKLSYAITVCNEFEETIALLTQLLNYKGENSEIVEHDALDSSAPIKEEKIIITPTQGAMDTIPEDEQNYLRELAMELIALCDKEEPKSAWVKLEAENLDSEQKVALWTLLPSKVRSALKNAKG